MEKFETMEKNKVCSGLNVLEKKITMNQISLEMNIIGNCRLMEAVYKVVKNVGSRKVGLET